MQRMRLLMRLVMRPLLWCRAALAIVLSRVIRLRDDPPLDGLVPWADFANHAPTCTAFFSLTDAAAPAAGAAEAVVLKADRPYGAGDEVSASYGAKASSELLVTYGFVPAPGSNPHDFHGLRLQVCQRPNTTSASPPSVRSENHDPVYTLAGELLEHIWHSCLGGRAVDALCNMR